MGLSVYKSCSSSEKRLVLRTFWAGSRHELDRINIAAQEYGPYALWLVAIITMELVAISALLTWRANTWAWLATTGSVLSLWTLWWTWERVRHNSSRALH